MSNTKKDEIIRKLSLGPRMDLSEEFPKASGVALLLSGDVHNPEVLFIKRALNPLDHWSGHLAFPGGKKDEGDPSLLAACLREVHEEIGLILDTENLIGLLDDLQARRRGSMLEFYIRPFVFFLAEKPSLKPDPREVEKALWVPLSYLSDESHSTNYVFELEGKVLRLPGIRFPDGNILWGLTYSMIENFFSKLKG